ncbi:hypothetical protein CH63R_04132 [Colletotrichum higginsianum IMI 349063]|uniref:Uncharacterized protein n=1 Tax=Colletotrichum higginsianum (strain IMI 349063) TaxID=759273 RepID=A0A1B7YIG0_COLHI|nr:hypothetical protein CH63R_04132 [Colletotrichum higginsianum IMI 349063]OBR11836.1 hypothetical protein CH63R_04132 [Colletotrichum higginsianum IMI 349063]
MPFFSNPYRAAALAARRVWENITRWSWQLFSYSVLARGCVQRLARYRCPLAFPLQSLAGGQLEEHGIIVSRTPPIRLGYMHASRSLGHGRPPGDFGFDAAPPFRRRREVWGRGFEPIAADLRWRAPNPIYIYGWRGAARLKLQLPRRPRDETEGCSNSD